MASQRSIMFVINGLAVGGAERQLLDLIPPIAERGHTVSLVTINDDMRLAHALPSQIRHYAIGAKQWSDFAYVLSTFWRVVRRERPDVIHGHLFQANVLSRIGKLANAGVRVINTTHCSYSSAGRSYNPYLVYRWTNRWVDWHTSVSRPALEELRAWGSISPAKSSLLSNAIDVQKFECANPGRGLHEESGDREFRWIAVGRLSLVKNYGLLLQAVNALKGKGHRFRLDIAGEGVQLALLRHLINEYDLGQSVRFLGLIHDLPARLSEYDGYVISSDNEALPMALLEAMAAGLPVVGTQVGEVGSLLEGSGGGYLVAPRDVAAFAAAMARMMSLDTVTLGKMGARNRVYVDSTFGMERIVNAWDKIYQAQHLAASGAA